MPISHVVGSDDAPFARSHRGDVLVVGAVHSGAQSPSTRNKSMFEPSPHEFTVEDTFNITGRGLAAVGGGRSDLPVGCLLRTEIRTPDGRVLHAQSYREFLTIRIPQPRERDAFLLVGMAREEVPVGSTVRVLPPPRG